MDIVVDFSKLKNLGNQIQDLAADYATEINKIYSEVENIGTKWEGADKDAFVAKAREYEQDIRNLGNVVKSYGVFEVNSANKYEQTQNRIQSAASSL